MSIFIMSRLFRAHLGSSSRKMMAVRLADFADDDGKGIWPTVARLCRETELSERTVQRILADFVAEGLLVVVKEASGRPGQATRYDFDLAAIDRLLEARNGLSTGVTMTPVAEQGVTLATETGVTDDGDGCHHDTRTVIEPLKEPLPEREARARELSENQEEGEEDPARLRQRVKVLELGRPGSSKWPGAQSSSTDWAVAQFAKLSPLERQLAEDRRDAYLASCPKNRATGEPKAVALGIYLRERKFLDIGQQRANAAKPEISNPYSRAWMGEHFYELLQPMQRLMFDKIEASIIDADPTKEARLWANKCKQRGWPEVVRMHDAAREFRGVTVSAAVAEASSGFVAVKVGGEVWEAWKRLHEARHWPFVPQPAKLDYVQFPPNDIDDEDIDHAVETALVRFEAELRARGRTDDAA